MNNPADKRILGLSPRARRFVIPFLIIATMVIAVSYVLGGKTDQSTGTGTGPVVGADLHVVAELHSRMFVAGHGGAGYRDHTGGWTQIRSLDDKDVMGWASTGSKVLAGGHAGLYASTDDGSTFDPVTGIDVSDVHALGASGDVVYLASPEAGTLVSTDGGTTFERRGSAGQVFMGNIWVDPANPDIAIAPSMQDGAMRTEDGGATWTPLGSAMGSMAVAIDRTGARLLAIGIDGAQLSTDGGGSWSALDVPDGVSAAAYTASGDLMVAARAGDRANIYQQASDTWDPLT